VTASGRLRVPQLEEFRDMEQLADVHCGADLLLAFPVERDSQVFTGVLSAAGQCVAFTSPAALFSEQQDLILPDNQGACGIADARYQFHHISIVAIPMGF
jgi:hypothetical protein